MGHRLYDVITIGSATVDVFAKTSSQLVKFLSGKEEEDFIAFPSGSKLLISELDFLVGGGGTNTAVSFSRLGLKTAFLGKIGSSENSSRVLQNLKDERVEFIGSQGGRTGFSIILDSLEQDRSILTFKGSNNNLLMTDFSLDALNASWLYSSSMVEQSFQTLIEIVTFAKKKGMKIAFNPSSYQAKKGIEILGSFLKKIDVLVMNLEEARLLLGVQEGTAEELLSELIFFKEQIIIITDGSKGATCLNQDKFYHISPSPHLTVVESTGAGDAFASGFVAGLIRKYTIEDALKLGMVQAQGVISRYGAKEGLLTKDGSFAKLAEFSGQIKKSSVRKNKSIFSKHIVLEDASLNEKKEKIESTSLFLATPEKSFKLSSGTELLSIDELDSALKYMKEDVFNHHVYSGVNHFSNWVRDVFNQPELAQQLRMCTTKIAMRVAINNFLQSHKKLERN